MQFKLNDHLDKLHAFKVIVESGSLREASRRLNVTQPSLSKLLSTLEESSGCQLLSRSRNGVVPTEAGKLLNVYAHGVLKDLADLEQRLRHPSDSLAGHLKIGAFASLAEYLWPVFLPAFKKTHPSLKISILTTDPEDHQRSLRNGVIDVLVDSEPRLSDEIITWSLYEDRFNFYLKPGTNKIPEEHLTETMPLIYSPSAVDHENKSILQSLEERGYYFKERIELDSFMAVKAFARNGVGLAVLPQRVAEAPGENRQLDRLALKNFPVKGFGAHTFAASILESRKDDPRIRQFIRSLKNWFK